MTNIDSKILEQAELILGSGSPAWSVITDGIYKSGEIYALAVSGTDIYVGGNFTKLGNANARHIAKWNGTSWSTLGGGCAQATETVYTIAISGTDIYVGGNFTSLLDAANNPVAYTSYIAKWNGSAWTTLARGTNGDVRAIAISGSKVYVGGIFSNVLDSTGLPIPYTYSIAKWDYVSNPSNPWSAMGGGVNGPTVYAIAISGSNVYVGGSFTNVLNSSGTNILYTTGIAKWDGSVWSPLGRGAYSASTATVYTITASGSDVYVGGNFTSVKDSTGTIVPNTAYIAKWNGSTTWSAIGRGTNGTVYGIEIVGSNMYVGGAFTNVLDGSGNAVANTAYIAKWDGSIWSALIGDSWNSAIRVVKVYGSNTIIGGLFSYPYIGLATWTGTEWNSSLGMATFTSSTGFEIYALTMSGADLYIGGAFNVVGNTLIPASNIAKYNYNSQTWSTLGQGCNGPVYSISVSGTDVYVCGGFTSTLDSVGATVAYTSRIAKWNGSAWSALGRGANSIVRNIAVSGTDVYISGSFTNVIDSAGTNVLYTSYVAKWDGSAWSALGRGASAVVYYIAISGSNVYICGNFTSVKDSSGNNVPYTAYIAKWDGSAWSALGRGANNTISSVATSGTDVYVGGIFSYVLSTAGSPVSNTNYIAKWDGSTWSALGRGCIGTGVTGTQVYSIFVSKTDVYVGGGFTGVKDGAGNTVANTARIAKWDGAAWSAMGTGCNNTVETITKAAGSFRTGATIGGLLTTVNTSVAAPDNFSFYGALNESVPGVITVASDNTKITLVENITVETTGDLTLNVDKVNSVVGGGKKTITVNAGGKLGLQTGLKVTVLPNTSYQLLVL